MFYQNVLKKNADNNIELEIRNKFSIKNRITEKKCLHIPFSSVVERIISFELINWKEGYYY